MATDNRRFARGSGVYKCADCGKDTRETGSGESELGLCLECMQEGELINLVNDGGWPELAELAEQNPSVKLLELSRRLNQEET
jgi:DNA-directed RNA polymerase subunit RPC12/RpoP